MIHDTQFVASDSLLSAGVSSREPKRSTSSFARHLEARMEKSDRAEDDQENKRTNKFAGDIASIKEKGLVAYFNELEAKKREEIRAEILEGMGLTAEDLGEMSPEQRAVIEKIVADEIQRRIIAASLINKDHNTESDLQLPEEVLPGKGPDFAFLFMTEETGKPDPFEAISAEEGR